MSLSLNESQWNVLKSLKIVLEPLYAAYKVSEGKKYHTFSKATIIETM